MIDLETPMGTAARPGDVTCTATGKTLLLLRTASTPSGTISLLNTHTYSQADFDAVGEVLLCPRPLGLPALDGVPLSALRRAFRGATGPAFDGPSGVTFHPLSGSSERGFVVQNFNTREVNVTTCMRVETSRPVGFTDRFSGKRLPFRAVDSGAAIVLDLTVPAKGRTWIQEASRETPLQ